MHRYSAVSSWNTRNAHEERCCWWSTSSYHMVIFQKLASDCSVQSILDAQVACWGCIWIYGLVNVTATRVEKNVDVTWQWCPTAWLLHPNCFDLYICMEYHSFHVSQFLVSSDFLILYNICYMYILYSGCILALSLSSWTSHRFYDPVILEKWDELLSPTMPRHETKTGSSSLVL